MLLTLYSALWMKNTILTAIFAIAQVIALLTALSCTILGNDGYMTSCHFRFCYTLSMLAILTRIVHCGRYIGTGRFSFIVD
ncbi:hypothetical protein CEXT_629221 [Caerostris extrusa]|uniref:Uncharacterized protein n=1 Tax=Caerostris extrusa TaxID=172846 RepID=A0AAV4NHG2_CAEEX|nr:hypothetical protein CEXT_629221 [Caerostris extrusa]